MVTTKDFYGKDVTTIIGDACQEFGLSQEELDIEIIETGSPGIFGLCRKKARIRVKAKRKGKQKQSSKQAEKRQLRPKSSKATTKSIEKQGPSDNDKANSRTKKPTTQKAVKKEKGRQEKESSVPQEIGRKEKEQIKETINEFLIVAGCPMNVELRVDNNNIRCQLFGEHEEFLTKDDGRTLDAMQYIFRKMLGSLLPPKALFELDTGDFRSRRIEMLKNKALELAKEVKTSGKSLTMPPLNPGERKEIHIVLQDDKDIRSRSIGEGLFKKVLIYKPSGNNSKNKKKPASKKNKSETNKPA